MMFGHEIKAKRQAKIKSKKFHQIQKKDRAKKADVKARKQRAKAAGNLEKSMLRRVAARQKAGE